MVPIIEHAELLELKRKADAYDSGYDAWGVLSGGKMVKTTISRRAAMIAANASTPLGYVVPVRIIQTKTRGAAQ